MKKSQLGLQKEASQINVIIGDELMFIKTFGD